MKLPNPAAIIPDDDGNRYFTKSCLLFCGKLADIHGRKLVFLIGIAWLGIFALGCGFARTASELLVLRGLQGIGSAAVVPSSVRVLI